MDDRLLRLAEKLGIRCIAPGAPVPGVYPLIIQGKYYYPSRLGPHFEWSLTGPDLGNVAAVVWERLGSAWIIELRTNPMMGINICKLVSTKDNSKYESWNDNPSLSLIDAACKAMGIE
jgi:hypothetical protein